MKTKWKMRLSVLVIGSLLTILGGTPALAQKTVDLRGQVVNGTEGSVIPDSLSVLMLITGLDGRLSGSGQAVTDAEGRFLFEDVQVIAGDSYTVSVNHLGVFYGMSFEAEDFPEELVLTIFEATQDASVIKIARQVMVIAGVDESSQTLSAIEFVQIDNPLDRTLVPDLTNVDEISFLRFSLPDNSFDLTVNSDLPAGDVVSIGTGFALASPVSPGPHNIDFSYTVPFEGETLKFRQALVQGTELFQVWVPEVLADIGVTGLPSTDAVNVQETYYRAYEGKDIPRGQGVNLELTGLPTPGVWDRVGASVQDGKLWQIAIPSTLGAAFAVILLYGLLWGYRPNSGIDQPVLEVERLNSIERATVVQAAAILDQRYQRGEVSQASYRAQRIELVSKVLVQNQEPAEPTRE